MTGCRFTLAISSFAKCTETMVDAHSCAMPYRNMAATARSKTWCSAADAHSHLASVLSIGATLHRCLPK